MKNTLRIIFHFSITLLTVLIFSCNKESRWDCLKRTGKTSTDIRILPPFAKIIVEDNINVFITQGHTQEVKVEAGNNLISLIKTEVDSGTLHIQNNNQCNWARSYRKGTINVHITMPTLKHISHFGSGMIKSNDTITGDTINILTRESGDVELTINTYIVFTQVHSTSDVTLHGKSIFHGNFHIGAGFLHCEDLQTECTWSFSKASGDEYLNAKQCLGVTIDWVGNIYYSGNPTIEVNGTGEGKLIHQN
ncbi:MAG: head GIN domain-containing protein [Bacteroidota bacterium]